MRKQVWLIVTGIVAAFGLSAAYAADRSELRSLTLTEEQSKGIEWSETELEAARELPIPMRKQSGVKSAVTDAGSEKKPNSVKLASAAADGVARAGTVSPAAFVGKIFFKKPDGNYVCSGSFISKNVVLTAAHCVQDMDTAEYYRDFVFVLQGDDGKVMSRHKSVCIGTFNGWTILDDPNNEPYEWDYALVLVDRPSPVGNLGLLFPSDGVEEVSLIGSSQDGKTILVPAKVEPFDEFAILRATPATDVTFAGGSGAPWIYNASEQPGDDTNLVVSLTSFGFDDDPLSVYGPVLHYIADLFQFVSNSCR